MPSIVELPTFANAVALTDKERTIIVVTAYERTAGQVAVEVEDAKTAIAVPHPAMSPSAERLARVALYKQMAEAYVRFVQGLAIWDSIHDDERLKIRKALKIIPERAAQVFEAQYLTLLTDYPAFHRWAELYEFTKSRQLTADLAADLQDKISLVAEATQGIDVGLRNLERLAAAGEPAVIVSAFVKRVTEGLHNEYISRIEEPVINDRYTEHGAATLIYPRKCDIFVPQEFSTIQYLDQHVRLELESTWANADIHGDLGAFTMRYLDSAYSTEAPLLVLGHPGSGKSLFTEMIAARLGPPAYHPIRLELRDIDADADLQDQIERQIRSDTGYEVNWAAFADELQNNPPVIILDGYDELLQAGGKVFSNYLTRVQSFQRREAVQGRPVRIIVTSRLTLIDKAIVPEGSTIVRLLVFSHAQRNKWTATWNTTNRTYFVTTGVKPFSLDPQSRVADLAARPLLLLMLAVYDSLSNQLGNANLDRTSLYHSLLVRFIERQRTKGESADAFAALTPAQRNDQIESDLERLGIAAIGMFNRQALHINRDDLNRDIEYFGMAQQRNVTYGQTLTRAELLLGSFFFIHESKSGPGPDRDGLRPSAFEFLHNTFGEFLTADFILRKVLGETRIIRKLSDDPQLLAMREYHLNDQPDWFACLIYTSLHTRPVVCSMMREWLTHKLTLEGWERVISRRILS